MGKGNKSELFVSSHPQIWHDTKISFPCDTLITLIQF